MPSQNYSCFEVVGERKAVRLCTTVLFLDRVSQLKIYVSFMAHERRRASVQCLKVASRRALMYSPDVMASCAEGLSGEAQLGIGCAIAARESPIPWQRQNTISPQA